MSTTCGVLFIHSTPSALCPHIEWAVGGVLGMPVSFDWQAQPAERGSYRTEYSWQAPIGTAATLSSALKRWGRMRFEVTEDRTATSDGERYSFTPTLGIFHATTGLHGDIQISEDRIKSAFAQDALGRQGFAETMAELIGAPWDGELEAFRHAGDGTPVRWLHQVG
ncbi:DUF3145 domain-containing protein [Granulicoccus phenolivorans]|uniref:DUF3145 domain-containing protein n=1 Tax=Granulicoccus phenolivorans TaxID=266854 RepID=UPI00047E274E|nr:DUF3145 domain-containing protein [Granulicoccus phenolivorans]